MALPLTALMVLANAFFVASEFAIVKMRPTRVKELVSGGGRRAWILSGVTRQLDKFLSANQLGITLASLALGWVGEPALARLLGPSLTALGRLTGVATHSLALGCSFVVITFLHAVLGELVPKAIALQKTEPVALWAAAPLRVFAVVTFPFIWALTSAANLFLRRRGCIPPRAPRCCIPPTSCVWCFSTSSSTPAPVKPDRPSLRLHPPRRSPCDEPCVATCGPGGGATWRENIEIALANQYTRYPLVEPRTDQRPRLYPPEGHDGRAGRGARAQAHARARARAHLLLRGNPERMVAPRISAPARAHVDRARRGQHASSAW